MVTELEVAALNTRLMAQSEPADDFACIPLAHVVECRADRQVVLDDRFIPSVLKAGTGGRLATFLMELQGFYISVPKHSRREPWLPDAVERPRLPIS